MPQRAGVILLGRWAVDRAMQRQGIGEGLLLHALKLSVEVANLCGAGAVTVDALNEKVKSVYLGYGFTLLLDDELHLFMPMRKIRELDL